MASAGAEAYAIMLYGSARTPSLAGLFVLLDGLREFDRRREVLLLRHEDDPPPSASLAKALRLFAPARVQPVPRLVLDSRVHPECARRLSAAWAANAYEGGTGRPLPYQAQLGEPNWDWSGGKRDRTYAACEAWWRDNGARVIPLGLRSVFTAFAVWGLTAYERILWLEVDQMVRASLEPLLSLIHI